jgi:hypothetical protein
MKLILTAPKPRNPFAPAARQRVAGLHQRSAGAMRQRARRELRREMQHLSKPSP